MSLEPVLTALLPQVIALLLALFWELQWRPEGMFIKGRHSCQPFFTRVMDAA